MSYRNCCLFGSLLWVGLFSGLGFCQPTQLDSVFRFEQVVGVLGHVAELPNGDWLVNELVQSPESFSWQLRRMTPQREFVWSSYLLDYSSSGEAVFAVGENSVFMICEQYFRTDSTSGTYRKVGLCYGLDGDSLWYNSYDDSTEYTSLKSAVAVPGGFVVLGGKSRHEGTHVIWQARLFGIDESGEILWDRLLCTSSSTPGNIVAVGDSLLLSYSEYQQDRKVLHVVSTTYGGTVLSSRDVEVDGSIDLDNSVLIAGEEFVDILWEVSENSPQFAWRQLRLTYDNRVLIYTKAVRQSALIRGFVPEVDGMTVVGYQPFEDGDYDIFVGRFNQNGRWHYYNRMQHPDWQVVYSKTAAQEDELCLLGFSSGLPFSQVPSLFYVNIEDQSSYLYCSPWGADFGIVSLDSTAERSFQFNVTGNEPVTITSVILPEDFAIGLVLPVTLAPGETTDIPIVYRPSELVVRDDTLRLICSAANDTFDIYVQGQAPFPVCAPDTHAINFNWIFAGDTVYRSLFVRNPGTATLHIDALEDPLPFWVEPHGPLEIPADSSVELTIGFTAAMADTFERTLAINSDEPDAPDSVRLKGRTLSHSTDADETPGLPTEFAVYPAYPNPFNATVTIRFDLPVAQLVELVLFDIQGRRVKSVLSGMTNAGSHVVQIDGGNFASGIYFAALKAGNNRIVQKLLLVK